MVRFDPSKGSFQWYFNQKEQKDAALKQVKSITEGDISNFYSSSEAAKNIVTNIERIVKTELPPEVKRAYNINFIINQAMIQMKSQNKHCKTIDIGHTATQLC